MHYITENKRILVVIFFFIPALLFSLSSPLISHADENSKIFIGEFSKANLNNWEEKVFTGKSKYQLVRLNERIVLKSEANASASGLFKKVRVDLTQTPFLNWSWQIEKAHPPLEERTKQGDDYAARIYLVVDGGLLFWKSIALNYVWSSSQTIESTWPSSYAVKNVMLVAQRTNDHPLSTWYKEKRNVYNDFKNIFEKEITHIDAVAIMTDSDNSGGDVKAYYGDIFFSRD